MKWVVTNAGPTSRTFKIGKLPGTAKNRWSCSPVTELLEKIMKETETNIVISEKESSGEICILFIPFVLFLHGSSIFSYHILNSCGLWSNLYTSFRN